MLFALQLYCQFIGLLSCVPVHEMVAAGIPEGFQILIERLIFSLSGLDPFVDDGLVGIEDRGEAAVLQLGYGQVIQDISLGGPLVDVIFLGDGFVGHAVHVLQTELFRLIIHGGQLVNRIFN